MEGKGIKKSNSIDIAEEPEIAIEIPRDEDWEKIDRERSSLGEFIEKFRREHDREKEGIEPEEWLEGIRERSSGC